MPDPSPHYSGIIGVSHHTCFYGAGIELSALYLLDKCSTTELSRLCVFLICIFVHMLS